MKSRSISGKQQKTFSQRGSIEILTAFVIGAGCLIAISFLFSLVQTQAGFASSQVKKAELDLQADQIRMALSDLDSCDLNLKGKAISSNFATSGLRFYAGNGAAGPALVQAGKMGDYDIGEIKLINLKRQSLWHITGWGPPNICNWVPTSVYLADMVVDFSQRVFTVRRATIPIWFDTVDGTTINHCRSTQYVSVNPRVTLEDRACANIDDSGLGSLGTYNYTSGQKCRDYFVDSLRRGINPIRVPDIAAGPPPAAPPIPGSLATCNSAPLGPPP